MRLHTHQHVRSSEAAVVTTKVSGTTESAISCSSDALTCMLPPVLTLTKLLAANAHAGGLMRALSACGAGWR